MNLAPQQTVEARKGAIAYGTTMIEVDLRVTADGVIVASHDADPASQEGGAIVRRDVTTLTVDQFKALNAATGQWAGTELDPARYQTADEVIALAAQYGTGMDIEFKNIGTTDRERVITTVANTVEAAGIMGKSIWQHGAELDVVAAVRAVDPNALFNYNIGTEPPEALYALASSDEYSFGSSLAEFTLDRIAAIHDGCGLSLPHSYDGLNDGDAGPAETRRSTQQLLDGIAKGVDGFQTNRPDAAADAFGMPVPSRLVAGRSDGRTCLVNAVNGLPLAHRPVLVGVPW